MNSRRFNSRKFRKGSLLSFVMVIALCLALLGLGMLQLGYWSRSTAAASTFVINARMAADAGLQAALYQMNLDFPAPPTLGTLSGNLDNSTASYTYDITDSGNYQIDSTGICAGKTRTVHAITDYASMFDYALFVTNDITMHNGSAIDAYNSNPLTGGGAYGGDNSGLFVEIGSETEIPYKGPGQDFGIGLDSGVAITGSVAVGTGLSPDEIWGDGKGVLQAKDPDLITGDAYSPTVSFIWSDPTVLMPAEYQYIPTTGANIDNIIVNGYQTIGTDVVIEGATNITPYHIIRCHDLNIQAESTLEIYSQNLNPELPVVIHVTGDLLIGGGGGIRVTNGSSLRIFLDEDLRAQPAGVFFTNLSTPDNPTPKYFALFGTSNPLEAPRKWTLGNSGDFYGIIYAPNSDVIFNNSVDYYGSISARSCDFRAKSDLHYDLSLAEEAEFYTGYIIQRWWEE